VLASGALQDTGNGVVLVGFGFVRAGEMPRKAADQGANEAIGGAPAQMAERHELVASVNLVD
jgi:hypothetical protein